MSQQQIKVPRLELPASSGVCRLSGKSGELSTPGTQAGVRVVDVDLLFPVGQSAELAPAEGLLPGVQAAMQLSMGATSNGARKYDWKPDGDWNGDVDIEILSFGGATEIYKGAAAVRSMSCKLGKKSAVVTIKVRLFQVDPDGSRREISKAAGDFAEVSLTQVTNRQLSPATSPGQMSLPTSNAGHIGATVGGIVVFSDDDLGEGTAFIRSVFDEELLVSGHLDPDAPSFEVSRDNVVAVHEICGPKGGSADGHIKTLAEVSARRGVQVLAEHLLGAIFSASDDDESYVAIANGWPLTSQIRAEALAAGVPLPNQNTPAPEPQGDQEELPPEPEAGESMEDFDILTPEVEES